MRILYRYIARDFFISFLLTLLVFLFVMAVANLFRVIDLFSRGVSGWLILQVFSYGMPFSLIFAIPMSVLAATFLNFSRMGNDREILAMQASGVSIWQIVLTPMVISALLGILCVYINSELAPASHYARRQVKNKLDIKTPLSFLDEGRFIREFPGYSIYIGEKNNYEIFDIVIFEFCEHGVRRTIRAAVGEINPSTENVSSITINLRRVRLEEIAYNGQGEITGVQPATAEEYPLEINLKDLIRKRTVYKKRADLSMLEILDVLTGELRFREADFLDLSALVDKINTPPLNVLASHVFAPSTILTLKAADTAKDLSFLLPFLQKEFNELLKGPLIYSTDLFDKIALNHRTKTLLQEEKTPANVILLNRLLLEQLFHDLIATSYVSHLADEDFENHRTSLKIEANTRLGLSFSCLAFAFLGAALGTRIQRRESSIGMALSLLLVFVFYFFIILADSLEGYPWLHPHLIVWIPFVLSVIIGWSLLRRAA